MQMSGKYATAEENSLKGLLMLLYVWNSIDDLSHLSFFDYTKAYTYGDDVLVGLSELVVDRFNNHVYAHRCKKFFGFNFTNSQKTGELLPWLDFNSLSFLKRKFVWAECWNRYVAPLDLGSICKSLSWVLPSGSITVEEQMEATFVSALWELFFHFRDEESFENFRHDLSVEFCCVFNYIPELPTHQVIRDKLGFTELSPLHKSSFEMPGSVSCPDCFGDSVRELARASSKDAQNFPTSGIPNPCPSCKVDC